MARIQVTGIDGWYPKIRWPYALCGFSSAVIVDVRSGAVISTIDDVWPAGWLSDGRFVVTRETVPDSRQSAVLRVGEQPTTWGPSFRCGGPTLTFADRLVFGGHAGYTPDVAGLWWAQPDGTGWERLPVDTGLLGVHGAILRAQNGRLAVHVVEPDVWLVVDAACDVVATLPTDHICIPGYRGEHGMGYFGAAMLRANGGLAWDLTVTPWRHESPPLIFPHRFEPWAVTATADAGFSAIIARPFSDHTRVLQIDAFEAVWLDVHVDGDTATVVGNSDRGVLSIATLALDAPRAPFASPARLAPWPPGDGWTQVSTGDSEVSVYNAMFGQADNALDGAPPGVDLDGQRLYSHPMGRTRVGFNAWVSWREFADEDGDGTKDIRYVTLTCDDVIQRIGWAYDDADGKRGYRIVNPGTTDTAALYPYRMRVGEAHAVSVPVEILTLSTGHRFATTWRGWVKSVWDGPGGRWVCLVWDFSHVGFVEESWILLGVGQKMWFEIREKASADGVYPAGYTRRHFCWSPTTARVVVDPKYTTAFPRMPMPAPRVTVLQYASDLYDGKDAVIVEAKNESGSDVVKCELVKGSLYVRWKNANGEASTGLLRPVRLHESAIVDPPIDPPIDPPVDPSRYTLESGGSGGLLRAKRDGTVDALGAAGGEGTTWELVQGNEPGKMGLRSEYGTFLRIFDDSGDRTGVGPTELGIDEAFTFMAVGDGDGIAFQARTGKFTCGEPHGTVVANRDALGPWETWKPTPPLFTNPTKLARIRGRIRVVDGQYFADDLGPVTPRCFHFGEWFSIWIRNPERAKALARQVFAAGFDLIRFWATLNVGNRDASYWKGRDVGPKFWPQYYAELQAALEFCASIGLGVHFSYGDLRDFTDAEEDALADAVADLCDRSPLAKSAIQFYEGLNEARDTGDRDDADPAEIEAFVDRFRRRHMDVLCCLSSFTGGEDLDTLKAWTPAWQQFMLVHSYRSGRLTDKARHAWNESFELAHLVRAGLRAVLRGEPCGTGKYVSATDNPEEMLDPNAMTVYLLAMALSAGTVTFFSSVGVICDEPLENMAGFSTVCGVLDKLPRDLGMGKMVHGGDRPGSPRVYAVPAKDETRADHCFLPDGRFAVLLHGPRWRECYAVREHHIEHRIEFGAWGCLIVGTV